MAAFLVWPAALLADESPAPLQLEFVELTSGPANSLLTRLNTPVKLYIRATNRTDQPLRLNRSQLQLTCDETTCDIRSVNSDRLLDGDQELAADESIEGWVSFQLRQTSSEEPALTLIWTVGDLAQTVSINHVLRELVNAQARQVGFHDRITVLSIERSIDLMTMWVLDEQLRELKKQGVERLVVDAAAGESTRLSHRVISWLKLANGSNRGTRRRVVRGYPPPPQFREFHVTGFQYENNSPGQVLHRSRELAVCAAARTLYEHLSTEEAVKELSSSEPGIRRAALESSIDRLPPDDLKHVLASIGSGFASDRQLLLEMLDRVSNPMGVHTLRQTLMTFLQEPRDRSDSVAPATAAVAAGTLVRCIVPQTEAALREVWDEADGDDSLREVIIQEVLRTGDHRWTSLASEFATEQLGRFTVSPSADDKPRQVTFSKHLREVIQFLHGNHPEFVEVARERLLHVTVPAVQDELLKVVVDSADTRLAHECIGRRLEDGAVTRQLLSMIHQLPDSQWTMRLLELHRSSRLAASEKTPTIMAAMRCATDDQLDVIIDQTEDLEKSVRPYLFQQLILMNHPRCVELLKKTLEDDDSDFRRALRYLPSSESPEMLQLVLDRYEIYRSTAAEQGELEGTAFRMAQQLLAHLGPIDHPEARRMINLSLISPEAGLRREAAHQQASSYSRSHARTRDLESEFRKLKREGKYGKALEVIDRLVRHDPYCSDFLMLRASLNMRNGELEAARLDVLEADRLSPGDVFTESTLALLDVRTGDIEFGLKGADAVMKQVPASAGVYYDNTLYNTACVYSRASEQDSITPAQEQEYRDRAMDLLRQSAEAGFYDEVHTLGDPDLTPLHKHAEWAAVIRKITANKRPKS